MKNKFVLITGGVRSGKSTFGEELAKKTGKELVYIATTVPLDPEMKDRVKKHREKRKDAWKTIEEPLDVLSVLKREDKAGKAVLIDCLTMLITNWMMERMNEEQILDKTTEIAEFCGKSKSTVIMVTNETGMGIVPDNKLGREFRDISGRANQVMAKYAGRVYLMVSGIKVKVK